MKLPPKVQEFESLLSAIAQSLKVPSYVVGKVLLNSGIRSASHYRTLSHQHRQDLKFWMKAYPR